VSRRGIVHALLFLTGVFLIGTLGYHWIEKASLLDSAYMTVITLATVGFRETFPLSRPGMIFTMVLIMVGVGAMGFTFTQLATFLISGDLRRALKGRQMEKQIGRFKNHVVVCGFGRIGRAVAENLNRAGKQVVVIDRGMQDHMDNYPHIVGDATEDEVLELARIKDARALAACLPSDADNLFITLSARALSPQLKVVARAISADNTAKLRRAGADEVISIHDISARRMASVLVRPHLVNLVDVMDSNQEMLLEMSEFPIGDNENLSGKSIANVNLKRNTGALILAVRHQDGRVLFNPDSDYLIRGDDTLIIMGEPEQISRVDQLFK